MIRQGAIVTATALVCAVVGTLVVPGAAHAAPRKPEPRSDKSLEEVRKEVAGLYRKAEAATDAYNAAHDKTKEQSKEIVRISREIVEAQRKMDRLKAQAGALARAQYRDAGGVPPEARVLLNSDPGNYFKDADLARKGRQASKGMMASLAGTQRKLDAYATDASDEWNRLHGQEKKKAAAKKEITRKLAAAEKLESRLQAEELDRLRKLEEKAAREAQAKWLDSGVLDAIRSKASAKGKKAIAYATEQLGKDYEWGAEGPDTYDCSGLTSQAWAAAGRTIPRTSQEQWKRLPRIDIEDMRPGDLIIYHHDASHVGMYVGGGAIVHAPRPGRQITVTGAGSMRILGVVRPDK